jgi:hypothetical protein
MDDSCDVYNIILEDWTPSSLPFQIKDLTDVRHFISLYGWSLFDKIIRLQEIYNISDIDKSLDIIIYNSKPNELYLMIVEKLSDPIFSFQGYKACYILLRILKYSLLELNDNQTYNTSLSLLLKKLTTVFEQQNKVISIIDNINEVLQFVEDLVEAINSKLDIPMRTFKYDLFIGFLLHIVNSLVVKLGHMDPALDIVIKILLSIIPLDRLLLYSYEIRHKIYEYKKWRCRYKTNSYNSTKKFELQNLNICEYLENYFALNDYLIRYASIIPWQLVNDELILEISNTYNELIENNLCNPIIKSKPIIEFERFHKPNESGIFWSIDGLSLISSRILNNTFYNWRNSGSLFHSLDMVYSINWLIVLFYPYLHVSLKKQNVGNQEALNYFINFIQLNILGTSSSNIMLLFLPHLLEDSSTDEIIFTITTQSSKKLLHSCIVHGVSYDINNIIQIITTSIMSCSNETLQKRAFDALKKFIFFFDEHSRFNILRHILRECPYNHMKGLILDIAKDSIQRAISNNKIPNSFNLKNGTNVELVSTDNWNNYNNDTDIYCWYGHSLFWSPNIYTFFIKEVVTNFMSMHSNHMLDYQQVLIPCGNIVKLLMITLKDINHIYNVTKGANFFASKNIKWNSNKITHAIDSNDYYNSLCDIFVQDLETCVRDVKSQLESLRQGIHKNSISLNDPSDLNQLELCIYIFSM